MDQSEKSRAQIFAELPPEERRKITDGLTAEQLEHLKYSGDFWLRPKQQLPDGDWNCLIALAGRGFGKTFMGAHALKKWAYGDNPTCPLSSKGEAERIALIGETAADVRQVMIEEGIMKVMPPSFLPTYEPTKRRLEFPNGAICYAYQDAAPDQLRGPQHHCAWADEAAKFANAEETIANLLMGLRLGHHPRWLITTTPRPLIWLRNLIAEPTTITVRGSTWDNSSNMPKSFLDQMRERYAGTTRGRQELEAELIFEISGSLFSMEDLEKAKYTAELPELKRVVVAIDPAVKAQRDDDDNIAETGIIVSGLGEDNNVYVLKDYSCGKSPRGWARRAISAFHENDSDCILYEENQGGAVISDLFRSINPNIPLRTVRAYKGKHVRAEPVSSFFEQGRVRLVGSLDTVCDQLHAITDEGIAPGMNSDRADALIYSVLHLLPSMVRKGSNNDFKNDMWSQIASTGNGMPMGGQFSRS